MLWACASYSRYAPQECTKRVLNGKIILFYEYVLNFEFILYFFKFLWCCGTGMQRFKRVSEIRLKAKNQNETVIGLVINNIMKSDD